MTEHDHDHLEPLPDRAELAFDDRDVGSKKVPLPHRFERLSIAGAVIFQLAVLVGMIVGKTVPFIGARTVLLQVVPVDPRDIFRGDYVTLGYDINRVSGGNFRSGDTVYASIVPDADGRHFHASVFSSQRPGSGVFIQGTARGYGQATYGIESYYVQEGTGHDYEAAVRSKRLWAEIALDREGKPALKRLVIE